MARPADCLREVASIQKYVAQCEVVSLWLQYLQACICVSANCLIITNHDSSWLMACGSLRAEQAPDFSCLSRNTDSPTITNGLSIPITRFNITSTLSMQSPPYNFQHRLNANCYRLPRHLEFTRVQATNPNVGVKLLSSTIIQILHEARMRKLILHSSYCTGQHDTKIIKYWNFEFLSQFITQ